jgi:glycosyltransferase involved in cell wall biosynthesis
MRSAAISNCSVDSSLGEYGVDRGGRLVRVRVAVLTTSYPRYPGDVAGRFIEDAVVRLREAGVEVVVVSPASFPHIGIAYGDGIANNLRARPWRVLLLPLFMVSFARAARRASRGADVVHAHWLPSAVAGLATGKPLVLQAWGSDVELANRLPWLFRPLLRRARVVVCASSSLAADARALGARDARVIPSGVDVPAEVGPSDEPPHVLYVGRLSEEKGIRELVEAAVGIPLVVVGDGPLRNLVPSAVGFVPHDELGAYFERAAIVCVPSRREGYGVTAREAMAFGRAVVTTGVGGLADALDDDVTGVLVPPRDPVALRAAFTNLLTDPALRERLGAAARARAIAEFSWEKATRATILVYAEAVRPPTH